MDRSLAIVALFALLNLSCASGSAAVDAAHADLSQPHISLMTYNVNFGLADDPETMDAIVNSQADVIFLQETTPQWELGIRTRMSDRYPNIEFRTADGAGGLAVLSRLPIEHIDDLPARNWFPAMRVVLDTPMGKLQVLNVHLRPPLSERGSVVSGYLATPPVRRDEIASFAKALDRDLPTLIVGDFNENEHGQALRWLREQGMRSALPQFEPHANTWRWQTGMITLHGRYDHIVYDQRIRPLRVAVADVGRSDHLPVTGIFALK
jgi:endonuclease/exonuclease/phosphatase family metal-dependent hydrolase